LFDNLPGGLWNLPQNGGKFHCFYIETVSEAVGFRKQLYYMIRGLGGWLQGRGRGLISKDILPDPYLDNNNDEQQTDPTVQERPPDSGRLGIHVIF
jgi:hypothetical protein